MAQTKSWLLMQAGHHAEEANRLLMKKEDSRVGEAYRRSAREETSSCAQAHALTSLALSALLQEVDD